MPKFAPLRSHLRFTMTIQTVFEQADLTRGYQSALTHLVEVEYATFKTKIHCCDSAIKLFPWRVHQRMTKFAPLRGLLWFSMCMKKSYFVWRYETHTILNCRQKFEMLTTLFSGCRRNHLDFEGAIQITDASGGEKYICLNTKIEEIQKSSIFFR